MCDQINIFHKKVFDVKGFLRVVGGRWGTKAVASLDRIRKSEAQNWLRWFRLSISLDIASWLVDSQCDQIGRFIALWPTFQSQWQQLFCPNCPHFRQFLKRCWNLTFFLWNNFWATFIVIWQLFTGHTELATHRRYKDA